LTDTELREDDATMNNWKRYAKRHVTDRFPQRIKPTGVIISKYDIRRIVLMLCNVLELHHPL